MKKLTKSSIDAMAELLPALDEDEQRGVLGGSGSYVTGSVTEGGYSWEQMDSMVDSGSWTGGYVDGLGYVGPVANVTGYYSDRTDRSGNLMLSWDDFNALGITIDAIEAVTDGAIAGLEGVANAMGCIDLGRQAITFAVNGDMTTYDLAKFSIDLGFYMAGPIGTATKLEWDMVGYGTQEFRDQGADLFIRVGNSIGKDGDYSFLKFGCGF